MLQSVCKWEYGQHWIDKMFSCLRHYYLSWEDERLFQQSIWICMSWSILTFPDFQFDNWFIMFSYWSFRKAHGRGGVEEPTPPNLIHKYSFFLRIFWPWSIVKNQTKREVSHKVKILWTHILTSFYILNAVLFFHGGAAVDEAAFVDCREKDNMAP